MKKKHFPKKFFQKNITKLLILIFIVFLLPIIFWASQYPQLTTSVGKVNSNTVGTIDPIDRYPTGDPPPENHPDLNLSIRGYVPANGEKYPIVLGEEGDPKAPQIWKILSHRPTIVSLYKIYGWDWKTNRKTVPMPEPGDPAGSVKQIQMIGLSTNPGEPILVPDSGYRIGGNYQVMVIHADENSITVKYGREDNIGIKFGYAVQVEGINVDPDLLNSYRSLNAAGRNELPALVGGQVMGTAKGNEIRVVIRDTGDFLDPRSKLDWWQGVDYPPAPTTYQPQPSSILPTTILLSPTAIISPPPTIYYQPPNNPQPTSPQTAIVVIPPTVPPTAIPTLTPTPTPKPILDIGKTVTTAKSLWSIILSRLTQLTKVILP